MTTKTTTTTMVWLKHRQKNKISVSVSVCRRLNTVCVDCCCCYYSKVKKTRYKHIHIQSLHLHLCYTLVGLSENLFLIFRCTLMAHCCCCCWCFFLFSFWYIFYCILYISSYFRRSARSVREIEAQSVSVCFCCTLFAIGIVVVVSVYCRVARQCNNNNNEIYILFFAKIVGTENIIHYTAATTAPKATIV